MQYKYVSVHCAPYIKYCLVFYHTTQLFVVESFTKSNYEHSHTESTFFFLFNFFLFIYLLLQINFSFVHWVLSVLNNFWIVVARYLWTVHFFSIVIILQKKMYCSCQWSTLLFIQMLFQHFNSIFCYLRSICSRLELILMYCIYSSLSPSFFYFCFICSSFFRFFHFVISFYNEKKWIVCFRQSWTSEFYQFCTKITSRYVLYYIYTYTYNEDKFKINLNSDNNWMKLEAWTLYTIKNKFSFAIRWIIEIRN